MKQLVLFGLSAAVAVATIGPPMAAPPQSQTVEVTTGTGFLWARMVSSLPIIVVEDCWQLRYEPTPGNRLLAKSLRGMPKMILL